MPYNDLLDLRPAGGFEMIMADPPWHLKAGVNSRHAAAKYRTMTVEEICEMPVAALAGANSVLWLWVTRPFLMQASAVMDAWGFEYKTCGHWTKYNPDTGKLAFGHGYLLRESGEPYLIATRGRPRCSRSVRSVIMAPRREYSRKPEQAYTDAEKMLPEARRLDLFSRQKRKGWVQWGDQADHFEEAAA